MGYGTNRGQVLCGECGQGQVAHIGQALGHTFVRATVTGAMGSGQPRWRGPGAERPAPSPKRRRTTRKAARAPASQAPSPGLSSPQTDLLAFCTGRVPSDLRRALLEQLAAAHRVDLPTGREPQFTDVLWEIPEADVVRYLDELRRREAAGEPLVRTRS